MDMSEFLFVIMDIVDEKKEGQKMVLRCTF